MIIPSKSSTPVCADCGHCVQTDSLDCRLAKDAISGDIALCTLVRQKEDMCGAEGKWFERRQNIAAVVDQAAIYVTSNGQRRYIGTASDPLPIAESDKAKAYRPDDPNVQEWIREGKPKQ